MQSIAGRPPSTFALARRLAVAVVAAGATLLLLATLASSGGHGAFGARAHAQAAPVCSTGLDVVLLLDSSASLSDDDLALLRAASHAFVGTLLSSADTTTRIGLVEFEIDVRATLPLTGYAGAGAISSAIDAVGHQPDRTYTNTAAGLSTAMSLFQPTSTPRACRDYRRPATYARQLRR